MARRPCADDLYDAANFLRDVHPDADSADVYRRVAAWLEIQAQGADRNAARRAGVNVAYYRKYLKGNPE